MHFFIPLVKVKDGLHKDGAVSYYTPRTRDQIRIVCPFLFRLAVFLTDCLSICLSVYVIMSAFRNRRTQCLSGRLCLYVGVKVSFYNEKVKFQRVGMVYLWNRKSNSNVSFILQLVATVLAILVEQISFNSSLRFFLLNILVKL